MIEGVSNSANIASLVRKPARDMGGNGSVKKEFALGDLSPQTAGKDTISLNGNAPEPMTYGLQTNEGAQSSNVFPVLRKLVAKMLQDQYTADRIESGSLETADIEKITPEKAKALVENDGHWKPYQTASRILGFAVTIAGNNPDKLEKMKASIDQGFQLAREAFDGELPQISGDTYSAVMNKLDEWAGNPRTSRR